MTFDEYQNLSKKTAIYPKVGGHGYIYPAIGLPDEAGEVAGKIKKIIRDKNGIVGEEDKKEIGKELGDVLWYVAQLASELGISLDNIAQENINKLTSRHQRNKLSGNGDNR